MVEVYRHRHRAAPGGRLHRGHDEVEVEILEMRLGEAQNHRALTGLSACDYHLQEVKTDEVKCAHRIPIAVSVI